MIYMYFPLHSHIHIHYFNFNNYYVNYMYCNMLQEKKNELQKDDEEKYELVSGI